MKRFLKFLMCVVIVTITVRSNKEVQLIAMQNTQEVSSETTNEIGKPETSIQVAETKEPAEPTQEPTKPKTIEVSSTDDLVNALASYNAGDTIYLKEGTYELANKVELTKDVTLQGEGMDESKIIFKGADQQACFKIASPIHATFKQLSIEGDGNKLELIWVCNTDSKGSTVSVNACHLINYKNGGVPYSHAISFEYASGDSQYYFDLTVSNSDVEATNFGLGSGLNNGNPDVSKSTLTVLDSRITQDNPKTAGYCIHAPKGFESLDIERCELKCSGSGIKYIYNENNQDNVRIIDNDFKKCNSDGLSIMVTNAITDLNNKNSQNYATELSGNNFSKQNTFILISAVGLETIWFPDGFALNQSDINNNGDRNITDESTRYSWSKWGANKTIIALTDFNIEEYAMTLYIDESAKKTTYYYNTKDKSGSYTNGTEGLDAYFSESNPKHCSYPLASWNDANKITRWSLGNETSHSEANGIYVTENNIAKVVVNTKTGEIEVTPKAVGSTRLIANVGAGNNNELPNGKSDQLEITVKQRPVIHHDSYYRAHINYIDKKTGHKIAPDFISESLLEGSKYDFSEYKLDEIIYNDKKYQFDSVIGDSFNGMNIQSDKYMTLFYTEVIEEQEIEEEEVPQGNPEDPEIVEPEDPEVVEPEDPEIVDPENPEIINPEEPEIIEPEGQETPLDDVPKTGDNRQVVVVLLLVVASGIGIMITCYEKKRIN